MYLSPTKSTTSLKSSRSLLKNPASALDKKAENGFSHTAGNSRSNPKKVAVAKEIILFL